MAQIEDPSTPRSADDSLWGSEKAVVKRFQEDRSGSWLEKLDSLRAKGRAALDSGSYTLPEGTWHSDDEAEYAGWHVVAATDQALIPGMIRELIFGRVPDRPTSGQHDVVHDAENGVFGNLSITKDSALTRCAIAELDSKRICYGLIDQIRENARKRNRSLLLPWEVLQVFGDVPNSVWPMPFNRLAEIVGGVRSDSGERPQSPLEQIERLLGDLKQNRDQFEEAAIRAELWSVAEGASADIAEAAPWYLALQDEPHDRILERLVVEDYKDIVASLEVFAASQDVLGRRAKGMLLTSRNDSLTSLTSALAWWHDGQSYVTPQPLAAPSSTWVGDVVLEKELQSRIDKAVASLLTEGLSEETEVTGSLIFALVKNLDSAPGMQLPQSTKPSPLVVKVTSTNSRTHEPEYGADLGIVLRIDIAERLKINTGHLVQIKQADNRDEPSEPPTWKIDLDQARKILKFDPTATYWLIQLHRDPKVISVSAKTIKAILDGRGISTSGIVRYEEIRSAATTLANEIVDLLIGLWIGDETAEWIAAGEDSRHKPATMLQLEIRSIGDNQLG